MNLAEFKAWLEGYSASFKDGAPNAEQWAEVSKRIAEVQPITVPPLAPYGSRPDETMIKPIDVGPWRPYYTPSDGRRDWPFQYPTVTC